MALICGPFHFRRWKTTGNALSPGTTVYLNNRIHTDGNGNVFQTITVGYEIRGIRKLYTEVPM